MAKVTKKKEGGTLGAPLWMITYGDMMTLLLCFFILLFSFSTLDIVKFRDVIIELQGALGVLSGGPMVLNLGDIPAKQITQNYSSSVSSMNQIQEAVEEKVEKANMEDKIETVINERGLMIRFTDTALFDLGKSELKPDIMPILALISEEIAEIGNPVRVEGHTDPTPINTPEFPSNWELSVARATAVVHWLIEEGGVQPDRLQAAGYAFYNPVVPNNTAENRARNRRVDVIILDTDFESDTPPSVPESTEEALKFLESPESDGIIMTTEGEMIYSDENDSRIQEKNAQDSSSADNSESED
ncbi:MAG TPA: flagellar motor protein MotB [bacterium]|jgi:chemotaxis protein MotB